MTAPTASSATPPASLAGAADALNLPCQQPSRAWREVELFVLACLVVAVYFSRLTDLTIRGEESRWARVALEMLESGDWVVPRQQGDPFPDRPPLNSWAMILASKFTGEMNLAAIRLPAVMATLLTTLLIYLYGRSFLSRVGAFAAAAAYPTMAQVLQLGRLAESDALLTLCMAGALFCWHYGYARRNDARLAWLGGYALAAAAGLAKGPQGPIYFVAITTIFLCWNRDWRFLFCRAHAAGLALFVALIGAWQIPFFCALDSESARAIWTEGGDFSSRFNYHDLRQVLSHWASYPLEVFVCTMPWSFMLLVLPTRWFRANLGEARPLFAFMLTACAVTFPTCWLPADSRARYFMSLYPCVALLVGLGIERCWDSQRSNWWERSWDRFQASGVAVMLGAGVFIVIVQLWGGSHLRGLGQAVSFTFALLYGGAALLAAAAVLWSRPRVRGSHAQLGIVAVAGFMGLSYSGIVVNAQMRTSNNPSAAVESIRELIPPGDRLLSFGPVHHLFAYYYQEPIELHKVDDGRAPTQFENTYFCFVDDPFFVTPEIPFAWERVAEISCERGRSKNPLTKVVIGRRSPSIARTEQLSRPLLAPEQPNSSGVEPATYLEAAPTKK